MQKRSGAYPSKAIPDAERFAVSIFEKVGDTFLKDKDLSTNGNVALREVDRFSVSAGQYGFMTQAYGKGYAPKSDVCKALRTPKDGEKPQLYLTAFTTPQLYKKIATEFNGKKTTEAGLKIYLVRDHEFTDTAATVASKVFIENARFLGLIDADGNFNINADINLDFSVSKETRTKHSKPHSATKRTNESKQEKIPLGADAEPMMKSNNLKKISIFIRGQELQFSVLPDMSQSDWDALIKQVQNIKSFSR